MGELVSEGDFAVLEVGTDVGAKGDRAVGELDCFREVLAST